jgi:hypothetical protein
VTSCHTRTISSTLGADEASFIGLVTRSNISLKEMPRDRGCSKQVAKLEWQFLRDAAREALLSGVADVWGSSPRKPNKAILVAIDRWEQCKGIERGDVPVEGLSGRELFAIIRSQLSR